MLMTHDPPQKKTHIIYTNVFTYTDTHECIYKYEPLWPLLHPVHRPALLHSSWASQRIVMVDGGLFMTVSNVGEEWLTMAVGQ